MNRPSVPTAALAGVPAGLQAQGVWIGHRQLFVRFAAEAETATMYTADALASEIRRAMSRSSFHSISITGRDPLANVEYLARRVRPSGNAAARHARLRRTTPRADSRNSRRSSDWRRSRSTAPGSSRPTTARSNRSRAAAASDMQHALVLNVDGHTTDAHMLRVVERAHETSGADGGGRSTRARRRRSTSDRRWTTLFERAAALHGNVRLLLRLPPPTGMR